MSRIGKVYKVAIDTNIWVSFAMGKSLKGFQWHVQNKDVRIFTCQEQMDELQDVLSRSKMQRYFTPHQIAEIFDLLDDTAQWVETTSVFNLCRDEADNYLLALAVDSSADFLITGDNDLLVLKQIQNTKIIKYVDFVEMLRRMQ